MMTVRMVMMTRWEWWGYEANGICFKDWQQEEERKTKGGRSEEKRGKQTKEGRSGRGERRSKEAKGG